jgi:hypothetical protein
LILSRYKRSTGEDDDTGKMQRGIWTHIITRDGSNVMTREKFDQMKKIYAAVGEFVGNRRPKGGPHGARQCQPRAPLLELDDIVERFVVTQTHSREMRY